jgi:hypothetical protein
MSLQKNWYYIVGFVALFIFAYFGTKDKPDVKWLEVNQLLRTDFVMLDEAIDSLEITYRDFHGLPDSLPHDSTAFKIVSTPFLATMEWTKFRHYFDLMTQNKSGVVASINGSGASTLTDRLAHFLASGPNHVLKISCAPQYDLKLHEQFIGSETESGFNKGKLLQLWDACYTQPNQKFVAIADNFDKINPETFFGPEIWEMLDDRSKKAEINGQIIQIPENFYFIAVTHAGVASKVELTNEHFRRLGGQHILPVSQVELITYLRNRKLEVEKKLNKANDPSEQKKLKDDLVALSDTHQLCRFVYFFSKVNETISDDYSVAHQLGQWSNVRKFYKPTDFAQMRTTFINHVNALNPKVPMSEKYYKDIDYTLKTNGLAANSSWIRTKIKWLQDTGYFVELTLILATSLITALAGYWIVRRKEKLLRNYGERTQLIFREYELQAIDADKASTDLNKIKEEVDALVLDRKLNYTEALYFLGFIDDKVKRIEFAKQTGQTFEDLYNSFAEDGVITQQEYKKLMAFLNSIRHKIPDTEYQRFYSMIHS